MKALRTLGSATLIAAAFGGPVAAQEPPGFPFPVTPPQPVTKNLVALKVQVVLSRYQGEKKLSSLPYTLSVNNDHMQARLRMGSKVAVLSAPRPAEDKNVPLGPLPTRMSAPISIALRSAPMMADSGSKSRFRTPRCTRKGSPVRRVSRPR